ncbi:MAG: hypothetical protein U0694_25250 [Anaerolineae bacterium]
MREAVTDFGGWGPWINGGAWLDIQDSASIGSIGILGKQGVTHEISECEAGRPRVYYQPGHPHGF